MEIAEGRPRRANAGNLLRELLEKGLDSDEEKLLQEYDDATTDSSFISPSDEETEDEVDTDFSDEEVEGTLKGELVETEATAQREERRERREEKQRQMRRLNQFRTPKARPGVKPGRGGHKLQREVKRDRPESHPPPRGSSETNSTDHDDGEEADDEKMDFLRVLRHRPPPTIPLATRLAQAHARAREVRQQQQLLASNSAAANEEATRSPVNPPHPTLSGHPKNQCGGGGGTSRKRMHARARLASAEALSRPPSLPQDRRAWLYAGPTPQRVGYHSSQTVMERFHVPVVISFSKQLPPVFQK
ncbi:unnamed protein product [Phytomonas sp. EM1]|nr:unnamed protein product [Phytomonas sp. EM1]|eukprot:CCW62555.1 unnamed protein product [Phytomonas sp. isolate EM1]